MAALGRGCAQGLAVSNGSRRVPFSNHRVGLESVSRSPVACSRPASIASISSVLRSGSLQRQIECRAGMRVNSLVPIRTAAHPAHSRLDVGTSAAAIASNSIRFLRSARILRHLNRKPWTANRSISSSPRSDGAPSPMSFMVQIIEKVVQFIVKFLPTETVVQRLEADVDAAAGIVQQGAKMVVEVADEVEKLADAAQFGAEEVEKMAEKVDEVTEKIKRVVDDVADVLEGEKGASTLMETFEMLNKKNTDLRAQTGGSGDSTDPATTEVQNVASNDGSTTTR